MLSHAKTEMDVVKNSLLMIMYRSLTLSWFKTPLLEIIQQAQN
jgi:hypothetical protein